MERSDLIRWNESYRGGIGGGGTWVMGTTTLVGGGGGGGGGVDRRLRLMTTVPVIRSGSACLFAVKGWAIMPIPRVM